MKLNQISGWNKQKQENLKKLNDFGVKKYQDEEGNWICEFDVNTFEFDKAKDFLIEVISAEDIKRLQDACTLSKITIADLAGKEIPKKLSLNNKKYIVEGDIYENQIRRISKNYVLATVTDKDNVSSKLDLIIWASGNEKEISNKLKSVESYLPNQRIRTKIELNIYENKVQMKANEKNIIIMGVIPRMKKLVDWREKDGRKQSASLNEKEKLTVCLIATKDSEGEKDFVKKIKEFTEKETNGKKWNEDKIKILVPDNFEAMNAQNIINAICEAEKAGKNGVIDCICIVRGGGDKGQILDVFNDDNVVKKFQNCSLPIFYGVGHASDETICKEVAFCGTNSPTDAADKIIDVVEKYRKEQFRNKKNEERKEDKDYISSLEDEVAYWQDRANSLEEELKVARNEINRLNNRGFFDRMLNN